MKLKHLLWSLLGWMILSSILSPWRWLSIEGFHLRCEGLITWIIIFALASSYWKNFKDFKGLGIILSLCLCIILILHLYTHRHFSWAADNWFQWVVSTNIGISTFAALSSVILYSINPWLSLLSLPVLYVGKTRSAWICAIVAVGTYYLITQKPSRKKVYIFIFALAMFGICSIKLTGKNLPSSSFMSGSRVQWIMQASHLMYEEPFSGYGLDTLSNVLKPAVGPSRHEGAVCDRVHNTVFDIILQIGWIGYGLCLAILAFTIHTVFYHRTTLNLLCFSIMIAWICASFINPTGISSMALMMIALFGIDDKSKIITYKKSDILKWTQWK